MCVSFRLSEWCLAIQEAGDLLLLIRHVPLEHLAAGGYEDPLFYLRRVKPQAVLYTLKAIPEFCMAFKLGSPMVP